MKTFAIIGAAGYIAPRHMKALKEVGGYLVAAYDKSDSVGVLDKWFPLCELFTNELDMVERCKWGIDYVVVCTPNYLHMDHMCKFGADSAIICEKPYTLDTTRTCNHVRDGYTNVILQLRLHPDVKILKRVVAPNEAHTARITYYSPRGAWYHSSWKGNPDLSGGILMNIGIHMFDLMIHLFGKPVEYHTACLEKENASGWVKFESGTICNYELSTSLERKPTRCLEIGNYTHDFTGFEELHTESYREILAGRGFGIEDARPSIELVNKIRHGIKL